MTDFARRRRVHFDSMARRWGSPAELLEVEQVWNPDTRTTTEEVVARHRVRVQLGGRVQERGEDGSLVVTDRLSASLAMDDGLPAPRPGMRLAVGEGDSYLVERADRSGPGAEAVRYRLELAELGEAEGEGGA